MDNIGAVPEIVSAGEKTKVILHEDLDLYSVPVVRPIIMEAIETHPAGEFVIDLSEVIFVDSAGLALLLALRKNPSLDGRLSVIVAEESHPQRVLQMTHLDTYINVIASPVA